MHEHFYCVLIRFILNETLVAIYFNFYFIFALYFLVRSANQVSLRLEPIVQNLSIYNIIILLEISTKFTDLFLKLIEIG